MSLHKHWFRNHEDSGRKPCLKLTLVVGSGCCLDETPSSKLPCWCDCFETWYRASVPFKGAQTRSPPDHLRSVISFSRICNVPNFISCIYICRIDLLPIEAFTLVVCLHGYATAFALKQTLAQGKIFLEGTLQRGVLC